MAFLWRILRAEVRHGDLRLLLASLLLAITMVVALTAFVERLQLMLVGESSQFLAADRALSSPREIDAAWLAKASELGLEQAQFLSFQSMLFAAAVEDGEPLLVSIKAANQPYPLKGKLKYRNELYGDITETEHGPTRGAIWLEARALQSLGIQLGDKVFLGDGEFVVSKELVSEPDRGMGAFSLGPRVLMHYDDIAQTGVVQLGSRLRYRYLFSGLNSQLDALHDWLKPQLQDSHKWLDLETSQPSIAQSLKRAKSFFLLASSVVIILAAIAIAMTSLRYAQKHIQHIAVLKTLGVSSKQLQWGFLALVGILLLLVLSVGMALGFAIQEALIFYIAQQKSLTMPELSARPFYLSALIAVVSLLAFTLPQLWQLKQVSAVRILRQQQQGDAKLNPWMFILAASGLCVLLWLYTEQWLFSVLLLVLLAIVVVLVAWPVHALMKILEVRWQGKQWANQSLQFAFASLLRALKQNVLMVAVFVVSLSLLVVLLGVNNHLFKAWAKQLPEKTPNYFLVNIRVDQLTELKEWFTDKAIQRQHLYPMVRGRLTAINDKPVRQHVSKEELKRAGADRELNLSWAQTLPDANEVLEGQWFDDDTANNMHLNSPYGVSVESQLAEKLGIQLGDKLRFQITADTLEATVTSLRRVEWNSMKPNFYMLFSPAALEPFNKTFMTSFYLPGIGQPQIVELVQQFPTLVLVDVDALIQQIRYIIQQVSAALQLVLGLVILASLLVLAAVIQSSVERRVLDNALLRAIGASSGLIRQSLLWEFLLMGLTAGFLASAIAQLALLYLQVSVFSLTPSLQYSLWLVAPLLGAGLLLVTGLLCSRHVLNASPARLLSKA